MSYMIGERQGHPIRENHCEEDSKNAFVSITTFEHHAHFTEWNHAENQVRFIRRVEEMGGNVQSRQGTPWHQALGKAKSNPPFDSEFCPGEDADVDLMPSPKEQTVNLDSLGKRGRGAYGTQRAALPSQRPVQEVFVSANINAMPKRQFKRYIRSLRALRPDFQKFINEHDQIEEKDLYTLAMNVDSLHYRRFLQAQMQKGYENYEGCKMEPQPHPNAALAYVNPTTMESLLWSKPKPGFILNSTDHTQTHPSNKAPSNKNFVVSFGGLTASIASGDVAGKDVLLDHSTEEGVNQETIENSILQLRVKRIGLAVPPISVGNRPQGLKGVRLFVDVAKDDERLGWDNPHPLGSAEYVAMEQVSKKSEPKSFNPPLSSRHRTFKAENFKTLPLNQVVGTLNSISGIRKTL
ncbi:hypothetical protein C0991_002956 [Blastosporella zonata]|nr:hypothetical protein C0991_002956 [Blastosporella zonata]